LLGDERGKVYGFSVDGGTPRWTFQVDATTVAAASIANGLAYFPAWGDTASAYYAVDALTGALVWSLPSAPGGHFYGGAINSDTVYVTNTDGVLSALNAATGEVRWTHDTGERDSNTPSLIGDTVYLGGVAGFIYAFDATTGAERWRFEVGAEIDFVPVVVDGIVYVSTSTGSLFAIGGSGPAADGTPQPAPSPTRTAAVTPSSTPTPAPADKGVQATYLWSVDAGPAMFAFPPDRTIWAIDIVAATVSVLDRDGAVIGTWGIPGEAPGQFDFKEPGADGWWTDVAFAADGSFWITECGNQRVEHFDASRNLIGSIGTQGYGDGQFQCPSGVVLGESGDLFVADQIRGNIQRFKTDGTFVAGFGNFAGPGALALDAQGNLIVPDSNGGRVAVLSPDGTERLSLGSLGSAAGQLQSPVDVAVDDVGNFYVADQYADAVSIFDPTGTFIDSFGVSGSPDGAAIGVYAIGYGGNGSVYITVGLQDGSVRVQKYKVVVPSAPSSPVGTPVN
jgi:outer membrane protein assembly factor BamB